MCFFAFPLKFKSAIRANATENNIAPALVACVIRAESNFNPNAVSNKGAVGLMQIMPATAEYIAKKHSIAVYDLTDPQDNIKLGTLYLRYLLDKFGDVKVAVMAYNAGEGNVTRWMNEQDGNRVLSTTPFPETNAYVEKVFNAMNYYKYRI
jgi:soluble lytic murein transglycosylase